MIIIETCPECGHDLRDLVIATYPPIYKKECPSCGWYWEGEPEEVMRVPFQRTDYPYIYGKKIEGKEENIMTEDELQSIKKELTRFFEEHPVQFSDLVFESSACKYCSNNPANGGSGICQCTLGGPIIYC